MYLLCLIFEHDTVKIHPATCDGNAIGFFCCAVHDCKNGLIGNRHRFCADHAYLANYCSVVDCKVLATTGYRTCDDEEHRSLEHAYFRRSKALFQLRDKLKRNGVAVPSDSISASLSEDAEVEIECEGKSDAGNRHLRACFGRRRTHNEQLIMRSCGTILSRATMYGSKAISAVYVSALLLQCYLLT